MIHNRLANRIENEKKEERAYTYIRGRSRLSIYALRIFSETLSPRLCEGWPIFEGKSIFPRYSEL